MNKNRPKGTSIIFVNDKNEILLLLRDDITNIPFPNCWDILSGGVEMGEAPEECIAREMKEEIEFEVSNPKVFRIADVGDRIEHTFWIKANFEPEDINLHEGQRVKWFSEEEIKEVPDEKIAFNYKSLILEFLKERPFLQ